MKRILFILFSMGLLSSANAQNKENKFRSREVIVQKGDTLFRATILTGELVGKPSEGKIYFYYSKGVINSNIGDFGGKLLNGEFKAFLNNMLIESGHFSNGCKTGIWESWYSNGKYKRIYSWKNGKLDGKYSFYNEDGSLTSRGSYKNGKLHPDLLKLESDTTAKIPVKEKVKGERNVKKENLMQISEKK
jgi:MORN repeat variant